MYTKVLGNMKNKYASRGNRNSEVKDTDNTQLTPLNNDRKSKQIKQESIDEAWKNKTTVTKLKTFFDEDKEESKYKRAKANKDSDTNETGWDDLNYLNDMVRHYETKGKQLKGSSLLTRTNNQSQLNKYKDRINVILAKERSEQV